jgi:hypothetical protein
VAEPRPDAARHAPDAGRADRAGRARRSDRGGGDRNDTPETSHPFLPWLDIAAYAPAPDGGFEAAAKGWTLDDATVVAGNEPWKVGGADDAASLKIPRGRLGHEPDVLRRPGAPDGPVLRKARRWLGAVDPPGRRPVRGRARQDALPPDRRRRAERRVGQPSLPMLLVANLLPLLPGQHTPVALRFVPQGGGSWRVDDVYIDPFRRF